MIGLKALILVALSLAHQRQGAGVEPHPRNVHLPQLQKLLEQGIVVGSVLNKGRGRGPQNPGEGTDRIIVVVRGIKGTTEAITNVGPVCISLRVVRPEIPGQSVAS